MDTLAAQRTTIAEYGFDRAFEAVQAYLDAHNAIMREMADELSETTTERLGRYGGVASMTSQRGDELARPEAQKIVAGVNVGFPLENYLIGLQWTNRYFDRKSVYEFQGQFNAALDADAQRVIAELQRALFTPTNNTSYQDRLVDPSTSITLPIRALLNADSTAIPADPWGATFNAATHTHYIGTASFVASDLTSLITLVQEHYKTGRIRVYINQAQEAAVRAFTGFTAYIDARIVPKTTSDYAVPEDGGGLNMMSTYDREIGIFGSAVIAVKPWMPANYAFAFNIDQRKPLARRIDTIAPDGLVTVAMPTLHPLQAQYLERVVGFAVQERANGAALQTNSGTYAAPTITPA